jgi:hypothetical protein
VPAAKPKEKTRIKAARVARAAARARVNLSGALSRVHYAGHNLECSG